jgi:hypothetical protein
MVKVKPNLTLAEELSPEEIYQRKKQKVVGTMTAIIPLIMIIVMALVANYILITYRFHETARTGSIYLHSTSETSNYELFESGFVRYNRDGVAFLNLRNREQWVIPVQFNNPTFVTSDESFVVFDRGGNGVKIFNRGGLIGQFETAFPIERITVSNQGIVSGILRNDNAPVIKTYDITGRVLIEKQAPLATMGYPTALALSRDGRMLAVGYLSINGGRITSRVVHYDFTASEGGNPDLVVRDDEFPDRVIVELFFNHEGHSVAITDTSFAIFEDMNAPDIKEHVYISEEIVSIFYTNNYIGYILLNDDRIGYELRLYNTDGEIAMSREFTGVYSNIRMVGNDIIMFDGFNVCIINRWGVIRFQGNLEVSPLLVRPATGLNRFYVMSDNDLRTISLMR